MPQPDTTLLLAPVAATAVLLAVLTLLLRAGAAALGVRPRRGRALSLTLCPLLFVAPGFVPGTTLAGTGLLASYVPWKGAVAATSESGRANPLLADAVTLVEPARAAARAETTFAPYQFGGTALRGTVLHPLEAVARLLPAASAPAFVQAALLLVSAWGFFVLMRILGVGPRGALLGALVFCGSGYVELWRAHEHLSAVAFAPWLVAAGTRLLRRPGPRPALLAGLAGGCVALSGHPQSILAVALLAAFAFLPSLPRAARQLAGVAAWGAAAAGLAALLAARFALPFLENLPASAAWAERSGATARSTYPELSARILLPAAHLLVFGDPRDGTFTGEGNLIEVGGGSIGTAALALLPAALAGRRRRKQALLWLSLGAGALLVAAGLPVVGRLYELVPGGGLVQQHRLTLLWAFSGSVLAGMGAERALGPRRRVALVTGLAVACAALAVLVAARPALRRPLVLVLEPASLALVAAAATRLPLSAREAALAAGLLLPRVAFFSTWVPATPASGYYPETPAVRHVRERSRGFRVAGLDHALLPGSAAFFGLEDVRGYDPMVTKPYLDFVAALGSADDAVVPRLSDLRHPALRFLGVRFVFAPPDAPVPAGWTLAYRGRDAAVFERADARPRLFVPRFVQRTSGAGAAGTALAIEDPSERVLEVDPGASGGTAPNGPAEVLSLEVGRGFVGALVEGAVPFLVATSQPAIPGWRLSIDGANASPSVVNGAFFGARVPAGRHEVRFEYRPVGVVVGRGLGAAGLLLGAVLAVLGVRARGTGVSLPPARTPAR